MDSRITNTRFDIEGVLIDIMPEVSCGRIKCRLSLAKAYIRLLALIGPCREKLYNVINVKDILRYRP